MSGYQVRPTNPFIEFKKEDIEQSIPSRFEQMVEKYPNRIALKTKREELTYVELNRAANRIANDILTQGDEGQEPVALLIEKSGDLIASILGTLKAGKIYVPLDPTFPRDRLLHIVENSRAKLVLTDSKNGPLSKALVSETNRLALVNIEIPGMNAPCENLGLSISPDDFAYILYTSGSTGQPKGVLQNHRNVLHAIKNFTNTRYISFEDRLSFFPSPTTLGSVFSIFGALLNGGATLPFDIQQEGIQNLGDWLAREEITYCNIVPTAFRHLFLALPENQKLSKIRVLVLSGEAVQKQDFEFFKNHFSSNCIFVNGYGSTEIGTVTENILGLETEIDTAEIPVGYPLSGFNVFLTDDDGNQVGGHVAGEITVKSRHLSPGYWRRPDLTQAAFLPDPGGGDQRIYRTGDLGRMLPDGCLIHLGRKDFQVQIRGFRVEMAEIEHALRDLPAVQEALVVAGENSLSDQRLVAYVVPNQKSAPAHSDLRSLLREKLPVHMVPSTFVMLEALPLTPTGKINRRALPDPSSARPELNVPFAPARTLIEDELTKIWSRLLSLDEVGIHDPFLEIGGNSLRATQIISRVLEKFQVEVPMQALMEAPTIAEMAETILNHKATQVGSDELERLLDEVEGSSENE